MNERSAWCSLQTLPITIIRNSKKYHRIHDRILQHSVVTSEQKKSLGTSEASEVIFNNKT